MGNNRLAIAGAALVVIGGLVAWKMTARHSEDSDATSAGVTLPKVEKDKVDTLEITVPGKPTVLLSKQGDTWKMTQPLESAVESSAVDTALAKLAELEVSGLTATRKENHDRLEVGAVAGIHVIAKAGGKAVCDLVVGKYANGNTMVREFSSDKVAAVRGSIRYAFAKDVRDWREHSITTFDVGSAKEVSFVSEKGSYRFTKDGDNWAQAPGETALPAFDGAKVQSLVSGLSTLRATDFAEVGTTAEQAGLAPEAAATVTLSSGGDAGVQQVVVRIGGEKDGNLYVQAAGNPVIYLLSKLQAERFMPDAESFKPAPPPEPSAAPQGMPSIEGIQGLPPGTQLPPEVMQQLQQQMQQQMQGGGH